MSRWACCHWWWPPVDWPCSASLFLSPGSYAGSHGASEDSLLEPKRAKQSILFHLLHHFNRSPFTQKWTPLSTAGTNREARWLRRRPCLQLQSRRQHLDLLHLSRCPRHLWKSATRHLILPWRQSPRLGRTTFTEAVACSGRSRIRPRHVFGQSSSLECDNIVIHQYTLHMGSSRVPPKPNGTNFIKSIRGSLKRSTGLRLQTFYIFGGLTFYACWNLVYWIYSLENS